MVRMRGRTLLALGAMTLVWMIGFSGSAPAAGGLAPPQLRFPAGTPARYYEQAYY
jgi:hypothetical protein